MRRFQILLAGAMLAVAGCAADASTGAIDLSEFAIAGPASLQAGPQSLEVVNSGGLPHTLVVTDSAGHVVAATDLIQSGGSAVLDVDLEDGRYTFTCRIVAENDSGDLVDHFEAGMMQTVSVRG